LVTPKAAAKLAQLVQLPLSEPYSLGSYMR